MNCEYEGLDQLGRRLGQLEQAGYLVLEDRTVRGEDERIGRLDLEWEAIGPYLAPEMADFDAGWGAGDDDDPYMEGPAEGYDPLASAYPSREPTADERATAARRWIIDMAERNALGYEFRRYRLRIYQPKGASQIDQGTILVRNPDYAIQTEVAAPALQRGEPEHFQPGQPRPLELAAEQEALRAVRALAQAYVDYRDMVVGTIQQFNSINQGNYDRLGAQLKDAQESNETLVGGILQLKMNLAERQAEALQEDAKSARHLRLAEATVEQIGAAVAAFAGAPGIDPRLMGLLNTISQDPELMQALASDRAAQLLAEPSNRAMLAMLLGGGMGQGEEGEPTEEEAAAQGNAEAAYPPPRDPGAFSGGGSPVAPRRRRSLFPSAQRAA